MAIIRRGSETVLLDVSWFWKPLIPVGKVTMLEGDGGEGKTTLILTVAAGLSVGQPPPTLQDGRLIPADLVEPVSTFYLTNEDEIADSSLRRFIRAGGDTSRFYYSGELEHHVTLNEPELRQIIEESGARLIIIDPFQAFLPEKTHLGNITRMREVFTMLSNVAKSTDTAIVLVGHLNKNESGKDIHRGFGSADIAASVRSILLVEMDKHRNRYVRAIKSNFDESDYSPIRLVFDENRCLSYQEVDPAQRTELISAPRDEKKLSNTEALLQDWLKEGPLPVSEIRKRLHNAGISFRTGQRARLSLGVIKCSIGSDVHWKLPD